MEIVNLLLVSPYGENINTDISIWSQSIHLRGQQHFICGLQNVSMLIYRLFTDTFTQVSKQPSMTF